jgi:hypothetical protein
LVDIVSPFDMDIIFLKGDTGGFCSDMLVVEISWGFQWIGTPPILRCWKWVPADPPGSEWIEKQNGTNRITLW